MLHLLSGLPLQFTRWQYIKISTLYSFHTEQIHAACLPEELLLVCRKCKLPENETSTFASILQVDGCFERFTLILHHLLNNHLLFPVGFDKTIWGQNMIWWDTGHLLVIIHNESNIWKGYFYYGIQLHIWKTYWASATVDHKATFLGVPFMTQCLYFIL